MATSTIKSINPSDYSVLGEVAASSAKEVEAAVVKARQAQPGWVSDLAARIVAMQGVVGEIQSRAPELAEAQSREMGMPIKESIDDIASVVEFLNWYIEHVDVAFTTETTFAGSDEVHQITRHPYGVMASIVPWNFPINNWVWAAGQSLPAGNTVVMKQSEEVPLCAQLLTSILDRHLPPNVFTMLYGAGDVGEQLVQAGADFIGFTGSSATGRSVAALAGKQMIPIVCELGGSAPGIIFEDANLNAAIASVAANRLLNQGQCCDGLKRLIVHRSLEEQVLEALADVFDSKRIGNATDSQTQIGPLVAKRQLDLLDAQVQDAIGKGAKPVCGGESLEQKMEGAFYAPTVLTNITPDMRVWTEEVFGPVLPVVAFDTDEEAIALANDTTYGLGAYVYTEDLNRAYETAFRIESGMVSVNGVNYVQPFNFFGGYKQSGHGHQHGHFGFAEVTRPKVIASPA